MAHRSDRDRFDRTTNAWRQRVFAVLLIAVVATMATVATPPRAMAQTPDSAGQPQEALQAPSNPTNTVSDDVRTQLAKFGTFVQHPKYGEVWVPTVTPQGWHPYPPCNWVKTRRYGWYYDDKTPWGQIVHHYGRWVFSGEMGWIWTPGAEFSPGWVVWRTSAQYVGWTPMLPEQDIQAVSAEAFNAPEQWLFMDAARFGSGCAANLLLPPSQIATLIEQTSFVTRLEYVDGIAVVVLPNTIAGPFVEVAATFDPYSIDFFTQLVVDLNFVFHHFKPSVQAFPVCTFSAPN